MIKPVKITFKSDEEWLSNYINDRSSPAAWLKDLAIAEYKRENGSRNTNEQNLTQSINANLFDMID